MTEEDILLKLKEFMKISSVNNMPLNINGKLSNENNINNIANKFFAEKENEMTNNDNNNNRNNVSINNSWLLQNLPFLNNGNSMNQIFEDLKDNRKNN